MFVGSMEEEGWKTQKRTKCELAWDILESWACLNGTRFNLDKYKIVPDNAQHVTEEYGKRGAVRAGHGGTWMSFLS